MSVTGHNWYHFLFLYLSNSCFDVSAQIWKKKRSLWVVPFLLFEFFRINLEKLCILKIIQKMKTRPLIGLPSPRSSPPPHSACCPSHKRPPWPSQSRTHRQLRLPGNNFLVFFQFYSHYVFFWSFSSDSDWFVFLLFDDINMSWPKCFFSGLFGS